MAATICTSGSPSTRFVSLGMVASTSEDPPPIKAVHCVPRRWVEPADEITRQVWTDAGTGGRPGSIWIINRHGLMAASKSHSPPRGHFYQLKDDAFFLRPDDVGDLIVNTQASVFEASKQLIRVPMLSAFGKIMGRLRCCVKETDYLAATSHGGLAYILWRSMCMQRDISHSLPVLCADHSCLRRKGARLETEEGH